MFHTCLVFGSSIRCLYSFILPVSGSSNAFTYAIPRCISFSIKACIAICLNLVRYQCVGALFVHSIISFSISVSSILLTSFVTRMSTLGSLPSEELFCFSCYHLGIFFIPSEVAYRSCFQIPY